MQLDTHVWEYAPSEASARAPRSYRSPSPSIASPCLHASLLRPPQPPPKPKPAKATIVVVEPSTSTTNNTYLFLRQHPSTSTCDKAKQIMCRPSILTASQILISISTSSTTTTTTPAPAQAAANLFSTPSLFALKVACIIHFALSCCIGCYLLAACSIGVAFFCRGVDGKKSIFFVAGNAKFKLKFWREEYLRFGGNSVGEIIGEIIWRELPPEIDTDTPFSFHFHLCRRHRRRWGLLLLLLLLPILQ